MPAKTSSSKERVNPVIGKADKIKLPEADKIKLREELETVNSLITKMDASGVKIYYTNDIKCKDDRGWLRCKTDADAIEPASKGILGSKWGNVPEIAVDTKPIKEWRFSESKILRSEGGRTFEVDFKNELPGKKPEGLGFQLLQRVKGRGTPRVDRMAGFRNVLRADGDGKFYVSGITSGGQFAMFSRMWVKRPCSKSLLKGAMRRKQSAAVRRMKIQSGGRRCVWARRRC